MRDDEHCYHHEHNEDCGNDYHGDCDDAASDDCVGCECCCIYEGAS